MAFKASEFQRSTPVPRKNSIRVAFEELTTIEILYTAGYLRQFSGWQRCEYGCLEGGLSVSSSFVCPSSENGGREQAGDFVKSLLVSHQVGIASGHGAPPVNGSARGDFASRPNAARQNQYVERWYW